MKSNFLRFSFLSRKAMLLLTGISLCVSSGNSEVTRKVIDRNPGKTIIYYQDGKEVARETIDREGNLTVTGTIPGEYYSTKGNSRTPARGNRTSSPGSRSLSLRSGERAITVNQGLKPRPFSRNEFARFRKEKVKEFQDIGIYQSDYDPFAFPHDKIYRDIVPGVGWTDFSFFYASNPYLLIILCKPTHVVAFAEQCGISEVRYRNGAIEEVYEGAQAVKFFKFVALERNLEDAVRIWMVNAQDAGFPYIAIDKQKCENIDFTWHNTPDNIANCIYSRQAVYHVGGYKLNNISPDCKKAVLKIKEMNKDTCIYVKLWTNKPANKNAKEDFAYIIRVIP